VFDEHRMIVAQLWDDGHTEDECEANARLIVLLRNNLERLIEGQKLLEAQEAKAAELNSGHITPLNDRGYP
jgi:hypothetical protein